LNPPSPRHARPRPPAPLPAARRAAHCAAPLAAQLAAPLAAQLAAQLCERAVGHAQDAPRVERTATRASWHLADGLPQSSVTGLAPAADGRLWVSTFAGITRFDGVTFEPLSGEGRREGPVRVSHLAADPADPRRIWVSTDAEGLWLLEDSERPEEVRVREVPLPPALRNLTLYEATVAPAGSPAEGVWLATNDGALRVREATTPAPRVERVPLPAPPDSVFHVDLADDGHLWLCAASALWRRAPSGEIWGAPPASPLPDGALPACRGGLPAPGGDLWALYEDGLWLVSRAGERREALVRVTAGGRAGGEGGEARAPHTAPAAPALPAAPERLRGAWRARPVRAPDGRLLVLTADGVFDLGAEGEAAARVRRGEALPATRVPLRGAPRASWLSPTGALWLGFTGLGLARVSEDSFERLTWPGKRDDQDTGPLARLGGELWFAHSCDELWRARPRAPGRPIERVPLPSARHGGCVDALGARDGSELLLGREFELLRRREDGAGFERHPDSDALREAGNASLIAPRGARRGDWWVGTRGGALLRLRSDAPATREALPPAASGAWVLSVAELGAGGGDLAVGHGQGVSVRRGGAWRTFTSADGLPEGAARHVVEAPDGALWVATYGGGLGWVRGDRAGRLPLRRGELTDPYLSSITLTPEGDAWLQGNKGLTHARLSDLARASEDPEARVVTQLLRVGEANGWLRPSAALTPEGELWLAGVAGVSVVPTRAPLHRAPLPPPRLSRAAVGESPLRLDAPTRVPAHEFRRLEVHYSAILLEPHEAVAYEHRLTDLSEPASGWVAAGRASVATYPRLAPGRYRFEVRSVSLERAPSAPVALTFEVRPALHERPLARWLAALSAVLLTALVGLWRTRTAKRRSAELRAEIEQRRAVEERLALSESHYRQVFDEAANAFLLYSAEGRCVEVNAQACALFGGTREALLATAGRSLGLPPLDRLAELEGGARAPLLCARLDGSAFPARMSYAPCQVGAGRGWLLSVMDLSALISAHERQAWVQHQLAIARRMDALGRLASGVAHDLNNILGALSGNIELLGEELPPDDPFVQESLKDVRESVVRGGVLSQQLLAFSRRQSKQRAAEVPPAEVLRGLERLLHRLTPRDVSLITECGALDEARVDRGQLELALLALTLNAVESSPPGGEVRVSLRLEEGARGLLELRLTVEDEGPPTPFGDLSALIDSYESAGEEEGAEDGSPALVRVHALMREARGALSLTRHGGRNRAVATWPISATPAPRPPRRAEPESTEGARVLLVDDNHELRRALARQLTSLGHRVDSFGDPLEALAALPLLAPPPALLITDVMMPGLNGRQLASEARARLPGLPVLFISGYTSDVLGDVGGEGEALLHKPFTKEVLRWKVLQLLRMG